LDLNGCAAGKDGGVINDGATDAAVGRLAADRGAVFVEEADDAHTVSGPVPAVVAQNKRSAAAFEENAVLNPDERAAGIEVGFLVGGQGECEVRQ
jgi:hypothetical protein